MCGRFAQVIKYDQLKKLSDELKISDSSEQLELNYNLAPSQKVFAIVAKAELRYFGTFQWGLVPSWMKSLPEKPFINVRSETILEKPSFKASFIRRRCLIPAAGFYEWRAGDKQPFFIHAANGEPLLMAGIYDLWQGADGSYLPTLGIITTAADRFMQPLHHRMPLIPGREQLSAWLEPENIDPKILGVLLNPHNPPELKMYPVSRQVGSTKFNSPECLNEVSDPKEPDLPWL